jgi:hypothetical protein
MTTLVVHVLLEVLVNSFLVRTGAAFLEPVVAVGKVVAQAGLADCERDAN